jgi:hypothetical protein
MLELFLLAGFGVLGGFAAVGILFTIAVYVSR